MLNIDRSKLRTRMLNEIDMASQQKDLVSLDNISAEAHEQYLLEVVEYVKARKAHDSKDFPAALHHIEASLYLDPSLVNSHLLKEVVLIDMGQYEEAIISANYSIQNLMLLHYSPFNYNKGVAFARLGRFDESIFCYLSSIEEDAKYTIAYKALLTLFSKKKSWVDILSLVTTMKENLLEQPEFLDQVGGFLLSASDHALQDDKPDLSKNLLTEAGNLINIAISKNPNNRYFSYNLACYYSKLNRVSDAIEALQRLFGTDSFDEKQQELLTLAHSDTDFNNIRNEPFFTKLLNI